MSQRSRFRVPFPLVKLRQLERLVRESHAQPIAGASRPAPAVAAGQTAVTFLGHSSFLLHIGGLALLVDPVLAQRLVVLRRQRHPGIALRDLPRVDAVLLTHAHMDHLNRPTLRRLCRQQVRRGHPAPVAICPLHVDDLLRPLGFSEVRTLDRWQATELQSPLGGCVTVTHTPAQHWGARLFRDTHRGYGGYVLAAPGAPAIYHSGDTAYFSGFAEIASRLRPQVALLPIGAYYPDSYRSVHTSPEEALQAFVDLGATTMVPMHFGTFRLGREPMDEPLRRLLAAADERGLRAQVRPLAEGETLFPKQQG